MQRFVPRAWSALGLAVCRVGDNCLGAIGEC